MKKRPPVRLDAVAPHAVLAAPAALDADELRRWAERTGQRFVAADFSACEDYDAVLTAIGRAFAFPAWYGANLDALYDCLTELAEPGARGLVVLLDRLPRAPRLHADQRARLLRVFRDALQPFTAAGVPLRVFYR